MNLSQVFEGLTEDKFCTGYFARDEVGRCLRPLSPEAVRWCVEGWMLKTWQPLSVMKRVNEIALEHGHFNAAQANDTLGYEFVEILRREDA